MKCSMHEDQPVIMVCQRQECETSLVCVLCIAGPHKGHAITTLEEVGKSVKKQLQEKFVENKEYLMDQNEKIERIKSMQKENDEKLTKLRVLMEEQGQLMHEAVDKIIDNMNSQFENRYRGKKDELIGLNQRKQFSVETVQTLQQRLGHLLEAEDWAEIIMEGKKTITKPNGEDIPEETTPNIGPDEINKTVVTGILSALQQCQPHVSNSTPTEAEADDHASDFEGKIYKHKTLESASCFTISSDHISNVVPSKNDTFWVIIKEELKLCCGQGIINTIQNDTRTEFRGMAISKSGQLLTTCSDGQCVKTISPDGKLMHSFSTKPLMPNRVCVANNGDVLVTLVSSFQDPIPDTVGAVSRYTPQGKRMITFERDRFGNSICPKYVTASPVSDMVVITSITNQSNDGNFNSHVLVMTGDLQVKFRYLSDGRVIPGDQSYQQDVSSKHFVPAIDSKDYIILGDIKSGFIEIIDKDGHILQCLGQVKALNYLAVSIDDRLWAGKKAGSVEVFKL
ncbi:uncharacterized protein [Argopecten irradians]|uniref:uncharacterized protein n=1 Tax=Argopecten irradians TaxID=31199 RepID=UPI00371E5FCF